MSTRLLFAVPVLAVVGFFLFQADIVSSQPSSGARDPGVREDPLNELPSAGGPIDNLTPKEGEFFATGKADFEEVEEVADGLGPRMNLDSCGGCHSQPATGGTSPAENPQFKFAKAAYQLPAVYSFIRERGPVREARFVRNPDGTPDGGVHALFTITGRKGADGCTLAQPDFDRELRRNNVIFRIPTPVFGAGLIEQIPDTAILANQASSASQKTGSGDTRTREFPRLRSHDLGPGEQQRQ